ncbi:hypothetical protein E4T38_07678 [Aureobasidium subglaciale]|nr:hypothetical protein E4T38_07678 [Aureobasidium subglaciale]KAI5216909.1 hypothetical protein E4T40_07688 [Aureobasidium subglaciale]KAI5220167.1 hypothetical protein E4T41_07603 [Aureobasidium subglaciale]KAI5258164.1 hypothetical protein E4T46_07579 [Aureobasidium subglaciale]
MLSKLHWQKRSNRKSQQSFEGHNLSPPQPSPELKPEKPSANPPSRRPGFLSRVRSQRFSTVNAASDPTYQEASSTPVPNKRHSYYQPAQPLYDTAEAQRPRSSTPEHFAPRPVQSRPAVPAAPESRASSIYTQGNPGNASLGGENLSAIWNPGQLVPDSNSSITGEQLSRTVSAMSVNGTESLSSESGAPLDRFMQRRLQRLNTEQGFREQRQASQSQAQHSKSSSLAQADFHTQHQQAQQQPQQQSLQHHSDQPLPSRIPAQVIPSVPNSTATTPSSSSASPHSHSHFRHDTPQNPQYQPLRNFAKLHDDGPIQLSTSPNTAPPRQPSMASSNQSPAPTARDPSILSQQQAQQSKDVGRSTPQPQAEDLTEDQVRQLLNDHKELREKYQKVKKYYFEKEDQVKQLQNSLAHQRIAQSRTSLDDGEYATRFNRLDGLIAQLSFSIRKSWKSVPVWLTPAVNKDAISIGKQEMTAVGRAFVSKWLVEDVFDRYFHPDLDLALSTQLKQMQNNIRLFAPPASVHEDEEFLTSKVVNWRLTTLEAMQDILRLPEAPKHRSHMTDLLKAQLRTALEAHLDNPPVSDLEGGVHMICELAVAMLGHLPQESRDVTIEYFLPGSTVNTDIMKIESGIPALATSMADEKAERGSVNSELADSGDRASTEQGRRRNMLSALTGHKKGHAAQGKLNGGSSTSLAGKEDRVRLAVGIAAHVRERGILVKAPVFTAM